jgi:3-deoxy-7-phosphoheptulonate synthase
MHYSTEELRIQAHQPLMSPDRLLTMFPLTLDAYNTVRETRESIRHIIGGTDKRLLVIVGPCSIHDTQAALDYASLLIEAANRFQNELVIVMRVYFEKPRTTVGWKGLISDPFLDGDLDVNHGLSLARKLLLELNNKGLPAATEFLDPLIPQYLSDLISWCAIGARTSESQLHRELASALTMPVGFKNSTDGNIQVAIDAVQVAAQTHSFLSINRQGIPTIMRTLGNHTSHIILRGSNRRPNFSEKHVRSALATLQSAKLTPRLMIDCSHGNSRKDYRLQSKVVHAVINQLKSGLTGICGIMLESNLVEGKQSLSAKKSLIYGQSITDGCIGWEETVSLLEVIASSIASFK